jgi:uncharacterized phage infection (PIP) family protein YhgE
MNETAVDQVSENPADELLAGVDLGDPTNDQNEESEGESTSEPADEPAVEVSEVAQAAEEPPADAATDVPAAPIPTAPPSEIDELRQQLQHLQTRLSELKYADDEISRQSARVRELSDEVRDYESQLKETKGELTAAKERYESAVRELRSMIEDRSKGQRRLNLAVATSTAPGSASVAAGNSSDGAADYSKSVASQVLEAAADRINEAGESAMATLDAATEAMVEIAASTPATDEHASDPISVLGQKEMIKLAGQDAWESAKNREEPFGMGKVEIETLEAAELTTIGKLEKTMRENEWWHRDIPKFGEKKVAKLVESLRVFRGKYPQPEGV